MSARESESAMLDRCVAVARDVMQSAQNQREANVFCLAAMVILTKFPKASKCLMQVSERYFQSKPNERLAAVEVVRRGWDSSMRPANTC